MLPGGGRNPRQMEAMMRRLGMSTEEIPEVEEVIVRTRLHDHVFRQPEVTILTVQGVRTYQVVGTPELRPRGGTAAPGPSGAAASGGPPEEDVRLVMEQANVSREEAIAALAGAHGEPAEAIMQLLTRVSR